MAESEKWQALGREILLAAQGELYLNLPFLDAVLGGLVPAQGFETSSLSTDGKNLYFSGTWLSARYQRGRSLVCRAYLHTLLHCVLRHLSKRKGRDGALWDLSCDIAVESILDGLEYPCLERPASPRRRALYHRMGGDERPLTAEAIYRFFRREPLSPYEKATLAKEFYEDDHSLWESTEDRGEQEQQWGRAAQRMQTGMETVLSQSASGGRPVLEQLRVENRKRSNYRAFLQRFAVLGEELGVDADSFDYGYYAYGLRHYGNLPLIEPLETREVRRVEDLVIAIDTSMSTSGELVRDFLAYTYSILQETESFFRRFRLRILQCDDRLCADRLVTSREELADYMEHFELLGQGGTDFRPVFRHVDKLRAEGAFRHLKGLLYFTDGLGTYPAKRPPYETVFILLAEQGFPERVPPWATRILLDEEELGNGPVSRQPDKAVPENETRGEQL